MARFLKFHAYIHIVNAQYAWYGAESLPCFLYHYWVALLIPNDWHYYLVRTLKELSLSVIETFKHPMSVHDLKLLNTDALEENEQWYMAVVKMLKCFAIYSKYDY